MKWPWSSIKKKGFPTFWSDYLKSFDIFTNKPLNETRIVVYDTETTGFDIKNDRILSIGAVAINNGMIDIADSFEMYINQEVFNANTVEVHGILKKGNLVKHKEEYVVEQFIKYIKNAPLVAHHAIFDQRMIDRALHRMNLGKLKNKMYDTGMLYKKTKHFISESISNDSYALDTIAKEMNISMKDRHTAAGDAYITALVFLKTAAKLDPENKLTLKKLARSSRF